MAAGGLQSVEMSEIRTLDVDKVVKGFALTEYVFKNLVTVSNMNGDSLRWYRETAADLTATSPSTIDNSSLAVPDTLEVTFTRFTSFPRKYMVEGFLSKEDIATTDVDILARSILRLTRAVVKAVDTRIYNILTESQSPSDIGTAAATGTGWDDTTNGNPILDIQAGMQAIMEANYDLSGGFTIAMNPKNHKDLVNYLIQVKGSSIPGFSSEQIKRGELMGILGGTVVVSNNVVADSVWVGLPAKACTWKFTDTTRAVTIDEPGIGTKIRVWEMGEPILTDPSASYLITDTGLPSSSIFSLAQIPAIAIPETCVPDTVRSSISLRICPFSIALSF